MKWSVMALFPVYKAMEQGGLFMKSLVSLMCLCVASISQQVFAQEEYNTYRLGNYNQAALPLLQKSNTDPVADYYLARMYLYGYGQLKNHELAMRYFNKAALKGFLPAVQVMAKYSLLHDKKPEEAVKWFKQAAQAGDINAQMFLAAAYLYGLGVKKNTDVAAKYYIDAAKNGNPIAQFALAEHFLNSRHATNIKLGIAWLNKSVASGNPKALTKLGSIYCAGKLTRFEPDKGIELLNKAIEQNYAPAMVELGDVVLKQKDYKQAVEWYQKAANLKDINAPLQLAHAYLQQGSPIYDLKEGFLWTLKAAEAGNITAEKELSGLYEKGIGVEASPQLAAQWKEHVLKDEKKPPQYSSIELAALWLTNGATDDIKKTPYQIGGIFSEWYNPSVLRNNIYNQAPQLGLISRKALFKPEFELSQPNDVPINYYYDALVDKTISFQPNQWTYPIYPLNKFVQAQENASSYVLSRSTVAVPSIDANYLNEQDVEDVGLFDLWTLGWQEYANYASVFNSLYFKAILGDAQAQFEIGQMFQFGLGVPQNKESAIIFYQNAAAQQHLGAEYHLGILNLQDALSKEQYVEAINWLTDSAFKGNSRAQYVLSKVLAQGKIGDNGVVYLPPNQSQAMSMLYISAANDFGPAEYDLAEHLARQYDNGLSVEVKQQKLALIRQLYEGAAKNGVLQALVPLAVYNSMDKDTQRQTEAFRVAEQEADTGDSRAAILLGLLYDRGIGTSRDPQKAMYWYQKSGLNPVSQFILGTYTYEGKGVAADKEKGIAQLQRSAESQFSYADFNLSVMKQKAGKEFLPAMLKAYELGNSHAGIVLADYYLAQGDDTKNIEYSKEIYKKLAEKGDQYAQLKLAYMLEHGLGSVPNNEEALHWYTESAMQGNPDAQYLLAQFYQLGKTGAPDYALAKQWYQKASASLIGAWVAIGFIDETVDDNYPEALAAYKKAAERGDPLGMYNLGLMYEYGKGVPVDYVKAKELYSGAAAKGIGQAMNQLGGLYFNGLGQPRDAQQGLSWYKKAAAVGNSNALYELGLLSETGVATKIDFTDALSYYREASEKGNEKAMLALARMYHYGLGVDKDYKKSASLYEQLAQRQNAYAQYQLGSYYIEGLGGERSPEKGQMLLKQASENGSAEAQKVLQRLEAQNQPKVSYIESSGMHHSVAFNNEAADLMYLNALNEWNRGDELLSRTILKHLVTEYPHFAPAKRVYEQINQASLKTNFG